MTGFCHIFPTNRIRGEIENDLHIICIKTSPWKTTRTLYTHYIIISLSSKRCHHLIERIEHRFPHLWLEECQNEGHKYSVILLFLLLFKTFHVDRNNKNCEILIFMNLHAKMLQFIFRVIHYTSISSISAYLENDLCWQDIVIGFQQIVLKN